jgi:hypothetical protein
MKRFRPLLPATARAAHTPRLVMLNQEVENLLRRQALMPEDGDGRVVDAECVADVRLSVRDADRACHSLRAVRRGITQAVFAADDM